MEVAELKSELNNKRIELENALSDRVDAIEKCIMQKDRFIELAASNLKLFNSYQELLDDYKELKYKYER